MPKCCRECGNQTNIAPIKFYEEPSKDLFICKVCVKKHRAYLFCDLCGDEHAYPAHQMHRNGYCKEHASEANLSEEDEAGWQELSDRYY
mgnify:CR=1 FL=1|jgi:hypothetical protein